MKILKNISRANIKTIFRGREFNLPAKHSMGIDEKDEEQKALYDFITQTYGFVIDITVNYLKKEEHENIT